MGALIEGVAGIKNSSLAFENAIVSPRWSAANINTAAVTARFAVSDGYVAYTYKHDAQHRQISMTLTGSGKDSEIHLLMPDTINKIKSVSVNNQPQQFTVSKFENSNYLDFKLALNKVQQIEIQYELIP